jgi:2-succinyl-5-enolpyruvyl-6-hydroxy-3-cyclohexene-1-carboxylate synthase
LSGIDGLIASCAGLALRSGKDTHGILGDLSTLHDLPSLALLSDLREKFRLTLWVMNNEGGEIFRIVGTAKAGGEQEWFTTPRKFDLSALAKAFQLPFLRLTSREDFQHLDPAACSGPGVRLVEVIADKETNLALRQSFRAEA